MPLESGLLEILACPACRAPLTEQSSALPADAASQGQGTPQADGTPRAGGATGEDPAPQEDDAPQASELLCTSRDCGLAYPVQDGIPVLLVDEARRPA
jgi:uncharacterized protein YbaR (Trm112 family)